MQQFSENRFRELCREKQLPATHQRLVIYRALMEMQGHPCPEEIYERVRGEMPSLSLATVYKTLRLFLDSGFVQEVSLHRGSFRIDANPERHHHFVCVKCREITDIPESELGPVPVQGALPEGCKVERVSIEFQGICGRCSASEPPPIQTQ